MLLYHMVTFKKPKAKTYVPVTDLSQMAVCEKQVVLKNTHRVNQQNQAMKRGTQAHKKFEKQIKKQDRRCYIATYIYGDQHENTQFLRDYRDNVLMHAWYGPGVIQFYYYISSWLVSSQVAQHQWFYNLNQKALQFFIQKIKNNN